MVALGGEYISTLLYRLKVWSASEGGKKKTTTLIYLSRHCYHNIVFIVYVFRISSLHRLLGNIKKDGYNLSDVDRGSVIVRFLRNIVFVLFIRKY